MICPNCNSTNISVALKQPTARITIKKPHYGILWWILLGWIYLIYLLFVLIFKAMYWLLIGWWACLAASLEAACRGKYARLCLPKLRLPLGTYIVPFLACPKSIA